MRTALLQEERHFRGGIRRTEGEKRAEKHGGGAENFRRVNVKTVTHAAAGRALSSESYTVNIEYIDRSTDDTIKVITSINPMCSFTIVWISQTVRLLGDPGCVCGGCAQLRSGAAVGPASAPF